MKEKKNKIIILLMVIIIIILVVLCGLFATETITFKSNSGIESKNNQQNENVNTNNASQQSENNDTNSNESDLLNSNIIVTQNGKVISNEIPNDLIGKYINKNSSESYIQLTNENIEISEPTGGGTTKVFKNEQTKVYINYLNTNENSGQYITVEFFIENNGYNQKDTYTYVGEKSSLDNKYHFKTLKPTPVGGEGNNDYPYSK